MPDPKRMAHVREGLYAARPHLIKLVDIVVDYELSGKQVAFLLHNLYETAPEPRAAEKALMILKVALDDVFRSLFEGPEHEDPDFNPED